MTAELSSRFKKDGMLAYVELIQRKEKEIGCDVLTHQKWYVFPVCGDQGLKSRMFMQEWGKLY